MAIQPLSSPMPPELAIEEEPFDVDELGRLLDDPAEQLPEDHPALRWRVDDDDAAEWAMRHLVRIRAALDELAVKRDDWMQRIDAWFRKAAVPLERSAERFDGYLVDYQRRRRQADDKAKTLVLPSGRVASTGTGGNAVVQDEAALIAWIRGTWEPEAVEDVVKVETSVRIRELRKRTRVVERQTGREIVAELDCGHETVIRIDDRNVDDGSEAQTLERFPCDSCPEDPVDGTAPAQKIVRAEERAVIEHLVVDGDDLPVPGLAVEPKGLNVNVKPDLA